MTKVVRKYLELFLSGFVLIVLGAMNTWQLAHEKYLDSFVFGFLSAIAWSFTVKRVAMANTSHRLAYAIGAATGGVCGLGLVKIIYRT